MKSTMVRLCSKFVHFDEVYRAPDKRLCVSCGFLRIDHKEFE